MTSENPYAAPLASGPTPTPPVVPLPEGVLARPERAHWGVYRRLAVTLGVLIAVVLLGRVDVPLPGSAPRSVLGPLLPRAGGSLRLLWLGLGPVLSAFVLVELGALILPKLRPLRLGGFADRARLTRMSLWLGLGLAALQGMWLMRALRELHCLEEGAHWFFLLTALLVAGTFLLVGLARLVSRFGLGQGYSVVLAGLLLGDLIPALGRVPPVGASARPLVCLVLLVMVPVLVLARPAGDGGRITLPTPVCGIFPLQWPLLLVALFAGFLREIPLSLEAKGDLLRVLRGDAFQASLLMGLALGLTLLFAWPPRVAEAWQRTGASPEGLDPWRQVGTALVRSLVLLLLVAFLERLLVREGDAFRVIFLVPLVFIGLDLCREWTFRGAAGNVVSVWPLHRVYEAAPALHVLREAGIPALAQGVHHRSLLQGLGPMIPIEILVPEARGDEALRLVHRVVAPREG